MASYKAMYEIEVKHTGLNKYRHIRGSDKYVVEQKARMLSAQWDDEWARKMEKEQQIRSKQRLAEQNLREKERILQAKEERRLNAEQLAQEAQSAIQQLQQTLAFTLSINDEVDWDSLKDNSVYPEPKPKKPILASLSSSPIPREPQQEDDEFQPKFNWLCYLLKSKKSACIQEAQKRYDQAHQSWIAAKQIIESDNAQKQKQHNQKLQQLDMEHQQAMAAYEEAKAVFKKEQQENNLLIDQKKALYMAGESGAVIDYCEMVLANSIYPDNFPKDFDLDYNADTKMLIVEYQLPALHHLPNIKDVRYLKSKDEIQETYLSEKEIVKLYDDLIYQITLRSLHELYEADAANALDSIVFNGLVTAIDKAHGNETTGCIVSIQASKDEFMAINLAQVDPKACFKSLKGVGSSQLHSLTPIPPILQIDKTDRRFVDGYTVADAIDGSTNLAAMSWEDFEHLIRELFEKEFRQNGGECKVTRASRDGGVDAIAFDPDPIRGGKIVIQAKRYTKTVGVSAVRDLYGTVVNEGATKGILVTTADYGPDSYEFAKGKPLTLLNGANLLHLLANHGHKAKIDLQAARVS
jgi:restriction system protein